MNNIEKEYFNEGHSPQGKIISESEVSDKLSQEITNDDTNNTEPNQRRNLKLVIFS